MTPWLFTTGWGALYLSVLALLMLPSLLFESRRWLALSMILLFIMDRASVNLLTPELSLFFLAFAYTLVAVAVTLTHRGTQARLMAAALAATSIAFIAGGFDLIDWDTTGTIQEVCGLIAMLSIIWRRHDGPGVVQHMDDRPAPVQSGVAGGLAQRRAARK